MEKLETLLKKAVYFCEEEDYQNARSYLEEALQLSHNREDIISTYLVCLFNLGEDKRLMQMGGWTTNSLGIQSPVIYFILASASLRLGDVSSAIHFFERTLELDPENIWAYLNLSQMYALKKRFQEALDLLNHAVSINPNHSRLAETRNTIINLMLNDE